MTQKPLIETNPYLKDPIQRKSLLDASVSSSTAIEGVRIVFSSLPETQPSNELPAVHERRASYRSRR